MRLASRPRIVWTCLAIAAFVPGCGGGAAVYPIAVGARGTLPTWNGTCEAARVRGDAVTIDGARYVALRDGDVELACEHGSVRLEVRSIASLSLEGPATVGSEWTEYRLVATGTNRRVLDLGDADVEWTLSPNLERDSSCHGHLVPSCDAASVARVRRREGGGASLVATLGAMRATREFRPP